MNRVVVIGSGGAGKTTFANKLSEKTGLPVYHLDAIFFKCGWVEEDHDVFMKKQMNWISRDCWIIDGNMHNFMKPRLENADTVIFLDYPTWLSVWGVLKRLMSDYGQVRADMADGCPESFDWPFLKYVFRFRQKTRPKIMALLDNYKGQIVILKNRKDGQNWLDSLAVLR